MCIYIDTWKKDIDAMSLHFRLKGEINENNLAILTDGKHYCN